MRIIGDICGNNWVLQRTLWNRILFWNTLASPLDEEDIREHFGWKAGKKVFWTCTQPSGIMSVSFKKQEWSERNMHFLFNHGTSRYLVTSNTTMNVKIQNAGTWIKVMWRFAFLVNIYGVMTATCTCSSTHSSSLCSLPDSSPPIFTIHAYYVGTYMH